MSNNSKKKNRYSSIIVEIIMMGIALFLIFMNILMPNQILLNISFSYWASCIFYIVVILVPKIRNEKNYSKTIDSKIEMLLRQLRKMFKFALGEEFYHHKFSEEEFVSLCSNKKIDTTAGEFHNGKSIYSMKIKDAIYTYYSTFLSEFEKMIPLYGFFDSKIIWFFQRMVDSSWTITYPSLGSENISNETLASWAPQLYELYKLYNDFIEYYEG